MSNFGNFIKAVGIGGGGVNSLEYLRGTLCGGSCLAINTDAKSIEASSAEEKILIGKSITRSMGAGGDISLAERAAQDDLDAIKAAFENVKLLFITVSLGGGTGSAVAPVAAKIARDLGICVIAFCTLPFSFEGQGKTRVAENAFKKMRAICNAAIALPNDEMLAESAQANIISAFEKASLCVRAATGSISNLVSERGFINVDFNSLKNTLQTPAPAKTAFAFGSGQGANYVLKALKNFESFPALKSKFSAKKADKLLVGVRAGSDTQMAQLKETLISMASKFTNSENVSFGVIIEPSFQKRIELTAIGLEVSEELFEEPEEEEKPKETQKKPRKIRHNKNIEQNQSEFDFVDVDLKRGFFDDTARNIYGKEDLDVPTFMRRNIKIQISKK